MWYLQNKNKNTNTKQKGRERDVRRNGRAGGMQVERRGSEGRKENGKRPRVNINLIL